MDYPENWPQPIGLTAEGASLFATAFFSAASKDDDWWNRAEDQAAELIASLQPIPSSEKRRQDIVNFVQALIEKCFQDVQVETFGSVPLKTYLPDGDIDLTALSVHTDLKETWAQDVVKALKVAEENGDAQFRVKDVQFIQADVKIIKCLVENIVVDISFNQTGGICTFCFLEQVDRYIGRDHLFKRSVILVKAWCYYESRLLGAHHGLISTYALETLVLYIFHVFHSSLRGPLKVLYTFLAYFSNFDWDKYCVSLWGPVPLALITGSGRISVDFAESPRNGKGSLLLTKEFLDKCIEEFSGVSTGLESSQGRHFNTKFLNVLDPIRDTNNLGRSVNIGSFKRIRSAFGLGARTLGEVLDCSEDQINERFKSFFSCTLKSLERYRSGGRPDTGNPDFHGIQYPSSGTGSVNFHERLSGGYKQEKGADTRHSPRATTYIGENLRSQFLYNYNWTGQLDPRPIDIPELSDEIQNDSTMRTRATPTRTDVPFSYSCSKDSGNTVNTVLSAPDTKQERSRATEPISSSSNATSSEGHWRQVGGKSRYTNVESDAARMQVKGSNYYTAQENFDRSMPVNRRSSEDYEQANHSFRSPMVGEYQARAPNQDSSRWGSSKGDLGGQGSVSRSRDISDSSLSLSIHDVGRPPGPSNDSKTSSSHRNSNCKLSSGDENDTSTSGRNTSEESKGTYIKWVPHQRVYTSDDVSYQGNSQDSGNPNMLQPLPYQKPFPFLQLPSHIYPAQMHLPVSSAIPVPASNSAGPPSGSSLHSIHHSPSSGELYPGRANSYVAMQIPPISSPALPATSSCMVSVVPTGDGANSHIASFSPHTEGQWEHWRSPIEDQMQPLHRAPVTSSASPGRSFPMESTSVSEGYLSPFSVAPPVLPQFVLGKLKSVQGGSVRPVETSKSHKAYGPIDENLFRLSISDVRSGEASSQLEGSGDYLAPGTKNRHNRPKSLDVKISDGTHAKGTKGAGQLSRSQSSNDIDVARNVDGHAAELRLHRISQPGLEETSVRDVHGALLPLFPSPHSHQEILPASLPSYPKSSPIQSGTLVPVSAGPYQSLQIPIPQVGAGIGSTSSSMLDRQMLLPISVGVPGAPSGSLRPPIIEHGSVSMGPSFRNRSMETVLLPVTVPQPMYFYYPPIFVMPTGPDGVFRGDSVGGLHSNGSVDFGTDVQGSRSRPRTIPQVGMGFAERPKGAGAVVSPRNKVETLNLERMSDEASPSDLQEDILCGSSKTHKENILRSFQYSCMGFLSPNFASRSPKGPQLWEGSGRQEGNLNLHAGLNMSQPLGGVGPSYPARGRVADGTQQSRGFAFHGNEETLPRSRAGTGAYLPTPRPTYSNRERSGPSGRGGNQHGAYGQQDRNNLEGANQPHAPRYRSVGQGPGQQNKHEPRAQTMNTQKNPAPDLGDSSCPQQQSVDKRGPPPVSSFSSHSSQPPSTGPYIVSSNGYSGIGSNAPPVLMQHSVNDGSTGFSPELEFGSLGPVQSG